MEASSPCLIPSILPTDDPNLHVGGYVGIHKGTSVTKCMVCPSPCLPHRHSLALSQAQVRTYGDGYLWENRLRKRLTQDL